MAVKKIQPDTLYRVEVLTPVRFQNWFFVPGRNYRLKGRIIKEIRENLAVLEKA